MKKNLCIYIIFFLFFTVAAEDNGLAPEVTDFNAKDASMAMEQKIPYLEKAFINSSPQDLRDGIPVGKLGENGVNEKLILKFAEEIANNKHDAYDSLLIAHKGKLIFESYYKRGRINMPHYQMSITKSYTAMALGRAMQLGYIKMTELDKPVVSFLKNTDKSKIVAGADKVTLHEAMHMRSGIRVDKKKVFELMKKGISLKGQKQIEAYFTYSTPITKESQKYKYQGSDPSITMQVLETIVPGSAKEFIDKELLGKLAINTYGWQTDVSGLPKSAAGSSMKSRDMIKWGILVMNKGKWQGEQLIPEEFVTRATSKLRTNPQGTSYGYFWWRHDMKVGEKKFDCISGRGAGGQFILMFPTIDLLVVATSHNKGMGKTLKVVPEKVLPAFID